MKLEILYKDEVVGSLSIGETASVPNNHKFTSDIIIRAVNDTVSTLNEGDDENDQNI
jgi:hypothetical protein